MPVQMSTKISRAATIRCHNFHDEEDEDPVQVYVPENIEKR